jgi:hypothetical protein
MEAPGPHNWSDWYNPGSFYGDWVNQLPKDAVLGLSLSIGFLRRQAAGFGLSRDEADIRPLAGDDRRGTRRVNWILLLHPGENVYSVVHSGSHLFGTVLGYPGHGDRHAKLEWEMAERMERLLAKKRLEWAALGVKHESRVPFRHWKARWIDASRRADR